MIENIRQMSVGSPKMCVECGYLHGHHAVSCERQQPFRAECPWYDAEPRPAKPPGHEDGEWICTCGAWTERGKWKRGNT